MWALFGHRPRHGLEPPAGGFVERTPRPTLFAEVAKALQRRAGWDNDLHLVITERRGPQQIHTGSADRDPGRGQPVLSHPQPAATASTTLCRLGRKRPRVRYGATSASTDPQPTWTGMRLRSALLVPSNRGWSGRQVVVPGPILRPCAREPWLRGVEAITGHHQRPLSESVGIVSATIDCVAPSLMPSCHWVLGPLTESKQRDPAHPRSRCRRPSPVVPKSVRPRTGSSSRTTLGR